MQFVGGPGNDNNVQFRRAVPAKEEKFTTTYDGGITDPAALTKKIAAITTQFRAHALDLKSIQDEIQGRQSGSHSFDDYTRRLAIIKAFLETKTDILTSERGTTEQLIGLKDDSDLSKLLIKVEKLLFKIGFTHAAVRKCIAISESGRFRQAYAFLKDVEKKLIEAVKEENSTIPLVIDIFDEAIKTFIESTMPDLSESYSQVNQCFRKAELPVEAKKERLEKFLKCAVIDLKGISVPKDQSNILLDEATQAEKRKDKAVTRLHKRALQIAALFAGVVIKKGGEVEQLNLRLQLFQALVPQPARNIVQEFQHVEQDGYDSKYDFWRNLPVSVKTSYVTPLWRGYKNTVPMGSAIADKIGQPLASLQKKFREHLLDFCRRNLEPIPENITLKQIILVYETELKSLKEIFVFYLRQVCELETDPITQTLFDYLEALVFVFEDADSLCRKAKKCADEPALLTFKALQTLAENAQTCDRNRNDLASILSLYQTQKMWREAKNNPTSGSHQKSLDFFLKTTLNILKGIHARRGEEILTLTEAETESAEWILEERQECQKEFSEDLILFIVKRMIHFLSFPTDPQDLLELVLHKLRNNKQLHELYRKSLQQNGLEDLEQDYEKACRTTRVDKEKELEAVARMAYHALLAKKEKEGISDYACARQKMFELSKTMAKESFEAVRSLFERWVEAAVKHNHYPQLYPFVENIWEFDQALPPFFSIINRITGGEEKLRMTLPKVPIEVRKQLVFESILLKLLSESIYASNPIEKSEAEWELYLIFTTDQFQELIAKLSNPIKTLISQNVIKKLIPFSFKSNREPKVTPLEWRLLHEGPFEEFFTTPTKDFKRPDIQMVLFKLINQEKTKEEKVLTKRFKECKRDEFKVWRGKFEKYIRMNNTK